eukprot:snap_masked-scaffold_1-processed-gene-30.22-mRNA-1 protein AED:1.00 eAED:1.00 QI:0/0/0/0/1/1/2/0/258
MQELKEILGFNETEFNQFKQGLGSLGTRYEYLVGLLPDTEDSTNLLFEVLEDLDTNLEGSNPRFNEPKKNLDAKKISLKELAAIYCHEEFSNSPNSEFKSLAVSQKVFNASNCLNCGFIYDENDFKLLKTCLFCECSTGPKYNRKIERKLRQTEDLNLAKEYVRKVEYAAQVSVQEEEEEPDTQGQNFASLQGFLDKQETGEGFSSEMKIANALSEIDDRLQNTWISETERHSLQEKQYELKELQKERMRINIFSLER